MRSYDFGKNCETNMPRSMSIGMSPRNVVQTTGMQVTDGSFTDFRPGHPVVDDSIRVSMSSFYFVVVIPSQRRVG